jgi:uncharacterized oligopeptide transporter (OPT) family protein
MYRLGLLKDVNADLWRIALWSVAASLYGIFFAIPLRKWFVIKQKLPFPSPTATAEIINSLHGQGGAELARRKTISMMITFALAIVYLLIAYFIPVLKSWRIFYWISLLFKETSPLHSFFNGANSWNWAISVSWAFIGAGMMTPMNTHISANGGSLLAWGLLGPILLATGIAPGDRFQMKGTIVDGKLIGVTKLVTARYWLLWPGLAMMMSASFTELLTQRKMLISAFNSIVTSIKSSYERFRQRASSEPVSTVADDDEFDDDPVPDHEQGTFL